MDCPRKKQSSLNACEGFYLNKIRYDTGTYNAKLLLEDENGGTDEFVKSWYPVSHVQVVIAGGENFVGTYKHTECMKFASGNKHMWDKCASVPYLQSFKRRLVMRAERIDESGNRNLNKIRFEYLTKVEKVKVLREKNKVIEMKSSDLFLLEQKALRLKLRVRSLKERLTEFSRRGDMKAICHQLTKADEKGLLKEKRVLMDTLETVSKNFYVKGKTGQRYKRSVKQFYESLLIMDGPRECNFVAINLEGPISDAIYKWMKVKLEKFKPGLWEEL